MFWWGKKKRWLKSIRDRQNYKVSSTSIFTSSVSQEDLFAFWFYLVSLKNMKQFGRVTCRLGETWLLLEIWFKYMQHWAQMMPSSPPPTCQIQPCTAPGILMGLLPVCCLPPPPHTGLLPAHRGMLWFNEVSTPCPDTSAAFAFLPFSTICCWMYSRISLVCLYFMPPQMRLLL